MNKAMQRPRGDAWRRLARRIGEEERGANLILVAMALMALLGVTGVAIDGSNTYYQQQRMQVAADAAAMGGARQLAVDASDEEVEAEIVALAQANGADTVEWEFINNRRGVTVVASNTFDTFFARLYGFETFDVDADSDAQYEPVVNTQGLFPMSVSCDCVEEGVTTYVNEPVGIGNGSGGSGSGASSACLVVMDEDVIDESLSTIISKANSHSITARSMINDDAPTQTGNPPLRWSVQYAGDSVLLRGGKSNDQGWFQLPSTITYADSRTDNLTDAEWYQAFVEGTLPQNLMENVNNVSALQNSDFSAMVGKDCIGIVYDGNVTLSGTPIRGDLRGNRLGAFYFRVTGTQAPGGMPESSSGTNYNDVTVSVVAPFALGTGGGGAGVETGPTTVTIDMEDSQDSTYEISFVGRSGNTWSYQVTKINGGDLSFWSLGISTCLNRVSSHTPSGATIGADSSTGFSGIKWNTGAGFTTGTYAFTLNANFPTGEVEAMASNTATHGTVSVPGPICDGSSGGSGGGSGSAICLPTLDFETDTAGASLTKGQIIDTEWSALGVTVGTLNGVNHPAMIFNTASPTGGDTDLGSPNQSFGGPGVGVGGASGRPGQNNTALGKVLIVSEDNNANNPDDDASGGTIVFQFAVPVRMDDVQILDIDNAATAGWIKAYSASNGTLLTTAPMLGMGDNSVQLVAVNAIGVGRLEINLPAGGAVASIISCRSTSTPRYAIGNLVWADTDSDGSQDTGEPGIPGVLMELYASGQNYVIATGMTATGGEYRFSDMPAGTYDVMVADSNFSAGGLLNGSLFSPRDAVADAADSDFNSATKRAAATIPRSGGDNFTIDAGITIPPPVTPGPNSGTVTLSDSNRSKYEISLESHTGNTWTYRVREVSGSNLASWSLGIANCLSHIVSSTPNGASIGMDSSTNFNGIKWSVSSSFSNGTFSFTLDANYVTGSIQALARSSTRNAKVDIAAPDCSQTVHTGGSGGTNPDVVGSCAVNVLLILDETYSIHVADAEDDVRNGVLALLNGLADTGSKVAIIEFNVQARTVIPYQLVTSGPFGTISNIFDDYLNGTGAGPLNERYDPTAYSSNLYYTNWEAGFKAAQEFNVVNEVPPLVVFFSDGRPNRWINNNGSIGSGNSDGDLQALNEAAPVAAQVMAQGSHIFGVGVGDVAGYADWFRPVSGPDQYTVGMLDLETHDYTIAPSFDTLEVAFRQIATALCPGVGGDCAFKWVDWNGPATTNLELKLNMENTRNSGAWGVGDELPDGPVSSNSSVVVNGFNSRLGDRLIIPLNDGSNDSAVCGFAQVRLTGGIFNSASQSITLEFLDDVVRSTTTDPNAIDYGVRDVRMLR